MVIRTRLKIDEKTKESLYDKLESIDSDYIKKKVRVRVNAIIMFAEGKEPKQISSDMGVSVQTIGNWISFYEKGGVDALLFRTKKGLKIKDIQDEKKEEVGGLMKVEKQRNYNKTYATKRSVKSLEAQYMYGVDYRKH